MVQLLSLLLEEMLLFDLVLGNPSYSQYALSVGMSPQKNMYASS